jgi:hypothetical protein
MSNNGIETVGLPINSKPGSCYAKCKVPDQIDTLYIVTVEYTGSDYENPFVEKKIIEISPATEKWEKRHQKDCRSANTDDCMVWCLVNVPAVDYEYHTVTDTSLLKDFIVKDFITTKKTIADIQYYEVLCDNKMTNSIINEVELALFINEFKSSYNEMGKMDTEFKQALVSFQKENNLPIGSLNLLTLDALGVKY